MKKELDVLLEKSQSPDLNLAETSLMDLRLIIERTTMNKLTSDYIEEYSKLFYDKSLIQVRLSQNELSTVKYFLFYMAISFQDRAILISRCIKVLFDKSTWPAVCSIIRLYGNQNYRATIELIYSITNHDDWSFIENKEVMKTFIEVSKNKNTMTSEVINELFQYYEKLNNMKIDYSIYSN